MQEWHPVTTIGQQTWRVGFMELRISGSNDLIDNYSKTGEEGMLLTTSAGKPTTDGIGELDKNKRCE